MEMQAVILAGGYGKRLFPLTEALPKPLLPMGNSTVYGIMADRLRASGFTDVSVTTMYKAEQIEAYPLKGMRVRYFRESAPLGTAGCVKNAAADFKNSFLVVSGDTICDFDLRGIMDKHLKGGCPVSVVCTRVSHPGEYGTVLCENGRITAFAEKPSWKRTLTSLVSTGIYVIDPSVRSMIGDGEQDFARDLFPALMASGVPIGCIEEKGYWCDVGDVESYYNAVFRMAGGRGNVTFGQTVIAEDAVAKGVIAFDGAVIESGAAVYDSIICGNAVVGNGAFVGSGSVIGDSTVIGEGAYISGGTILKGGLTVEKGARIMKSIVFGEIRKRHMENGRIKGKYGSYINGSLCLSLGSALSYTAGAGAAIGVMHGEGTESKALADSILCGIRLYGGRALDLEDGFESLAAFAAPEYGLAFSVIVRVEGSSASISVFDGDGLPPTHKEERAIEAAMLRPVPTAVSAGEVSRLESEERVKFRYASRLVDTTPDLSGLSLYVGEKNAASEFLYSVAEKRGASVKYGKGAERDTFYVSEDGLYAEGVLAGGTECGFWGLMALGAIMGGEVALPPLTPRFVENAVIKAGGRPIFYGETGGREREAVYRCLWSYDANALILRVLLAAKVTKKPLTELYQSMPKQIVETKTVRCDEEKEARTIERLCEKGSVGRCGEGVLLSYSSGSVVVLPMDKGAFRLFAEAVSVEAAEDLFSKTEREIKKAEE